MAWTKCKHSQCSCKVKEGGVYDTYCSEYCQLAGDEVTDVFFDGTTITLLPGARHPDGAAHGSGCTHSSTLAAHLALGASPLDAARAAKEAASRAVNQGLRDIGEGPGPVNVLGLGSGLS